MAAPTRLAWLGMLQHVEMEIDMIDERLPLFKIASNIFDSLTMEDINQTALDMQELGLYQPPFDAFYIQVKTRFMENLASAYYKSEVRYGLGIKTEMMFKYVMMDAHVRMTPFFSLDGKEFGTLSHDEVEGMGPQAEKQLTWFGHTISKVLTVLLATKNIEKDVEACNKPTSRNRRERTLSKYSSVTTIRIGKITETMRSIGGSGSSVRPHLRRGHIRHQHYGKGNTELKKIFIQPMFINADQGWIDGQKEYRVVA